MRSSSRFFLWLSALAVLLCGCAGETAPSPEFTLQYETPPEAFPADGGVFEVSLHWKACQIDVSVQEVYVQPSLYHVGSIDGEGDVSLTFTLAPNTGYTLREAHLAFVPSDGSEPREIVLSQEGLGLEEASVTVDPSLRFQSWDGFGAMNLGTNWKNNTDWSETDADALLGDMGISIMRIRIPYDESRWEALAEECRYAYRQYGVKILATPWSMPSSMKDPEQIPAKKDGVTTSLKPECYEEYARYLERFAAFMKDAGVPIEAISVQNEPDYAPEYDGCLWSAAQHLAFVRDYGQLIRSAALVTAESFSSRQAFYDPVLQDATACSHIDIVGGHLYGTTPEPYDLAAEKGKRLWMTEHLLNASWSDGTDHWEETLQMLQEIHQCILCGWNAYIWWYGCRYYSLAGDGDEGTTRGEILPRGYAYAHFSKYIRPGDVRVAATVSGAQSLLGCAFEGSDGGLRIVLVNLTESRKDITLDAGVAEGSAWGIYTSPQMNAASLDLEADSPHAIRFSLPGRSVATLLVR